MTREMIDQYLDGALDVSGRMAVERELQMDASAAALLSRMKSERAVRAAALASYAPSAGEARELAAGVMAACHDSELAPVGRIGPWVWARRVAGVAAAIVVVAGAYMMGQANGASQVVEVPVEKTVYNLMVSTDSRGEPVLQVFDTQEARDAYLRDLDAPKSGVLALNTNEPGIF